MAWVLFFYTLLFMSSMEEWGILSPGITTSCHTFTALIQVPFLSSRFDFVKKMHTPFLFML